MGINICKLNEVYRNLDNSTNGKVVVNGNEFYVYGLPKNSQVGDWIACSIKTRKSYYEFFKSIGKILERVPENLLLKAEAEDVFRNKVKKYLETKGIFLDKFTVESRTEYASPTGENKILNDNKLGYISEHVVAEYLRKYSDDIEVSFWADDDTKARVQEIVDLDSSNPEDIKFVSNYFYDKYDLKVTSIEHGESLKLDVKSSGTKNIPVANWTFQYPVVQNQRAGKDGAILCYCVVDSNGVIYPFLIGYITENEISQSEVLHRGELSEHNVEQHIDNLKTSMSQYEDLSKIIETLREMNR